MLDAPGAVDDVSTGLRGRTLSTPSALPNHSTDSKWVSLLEAYTSSTDNGKTYGGQRVFNVHYVDSKSTRSKHQRSPSFHAIHHYSSSANDLSLWSSEDTGANETCRSAINPLPHRTNNQGFPFCPPATPSHPASTCTHTESYRNDPTTRKQRDRQQPHRKRAT